MAVTAETVLWRVALGCSFLMLLGPMADRTTYAKRSGFVFITDAAGYNIVALLSGVVALGALGFAAWARPRVFLTALALAGAVAAFGLTVFMSGLAVSARFQGEVWFYGTDSYATDAAEMGRRVTIDAADGPYFFVAAALLGAIATLGLGVMWLRQSRSERPSAEAPVMSAEALRWVAFACAVALLFGPLGGRTVIVDGTTTITDSAAYNVAAVFSGIVAIVGLAIADRDRPRPVLVALGAAVAIAAFALTAYFAGRFSLPLFRGEVMLDGGSIIRVAPGVDPAYGPPFFAFAALLGAASTVAFAIHRLRQFRGA